MISLLMTSVGLEHMEVLFPATVKKILKHFLIKHMSTLFYYSILHHFHLQPHSNQQQIRLSKNIKLLYLFCMIIIRDAECKYQEQNIQHVIISGHKCVCCWQKTPDTRITWERSDVTCLSTNNTEGSML